MKNNWIECTPENIEPGDIVRLKGSGDDEGEYIVEHVFKAGEVNKGCKFTGEFNGVETVKDTYYYDKLSN